MRFRSMAGVVAATAIVVAMAAAAGVRSGVVSAQGAPPIAMTAIDDLNMSPEQAVWLSGHGAEIAPGDVQTFRFGDDPSGTPTLAEADSAWLTPDRLGAGLVEWGSDTLPAVSGEGVQTNGDIWATIGGGPKPDTIYVLYWAELNGPLPGPDGPDLWQNLAFPTSLHDHEGWVAQAPYVGDTWQGAAFVPMLTYGPDPWSFGVQEVVGGDLVDRNDLSGFAYVGDTTLVMAFEASPLLGDSPPEMLPWIGVGFAGHAHDGSFGATPDGLSRVTAWPGDLGPRSDPLPPVSEGSERVLRVGFEPRVDPVGVWGVVDDSDGLWIDTRFAAPFGSPPPDDLFSVFVSFEVGMSGEPGSSAGGWSLHDGEIDHTNFIPGVGEPPSPEMYVAGDGSILWNTGLRVDDVFQGDPMVPVTVESGFRPDEATTQARFATNMFELSASDLIHEDPLTHGGPPTWDLISGGAVEAADDTIPPNTDETPTAKPTPTEKSTTTEKSAGSAGQDSAGQDGGEHDGGSNTGSIVLIIGGFIVIIAGGVIWWRRRGTPGYDDGVRVGLGPGPAVPGGGVVTGPGTLPGPGTLVGPGTRLGLGGAVVPGTPVGGSPVGPGTLPGPGTLVVPPKSTGDAKADDTAVDDGDDTGTTTDDTADGDDTADSDGTKADDTADGDDTGTSSDEDTSTGVVTANSGVDYFGKRDGEQPKRDCSDLVAECRRLTDLADISDRQVEEAGERVDDLVARLAEAESLHARLEQRLADLVRHDDAPNQFERMAELQADIRRADQRVRDITHDKQTAMDTLEAVKKEAWRSRAEARKACKAAADCEAGNG